VSIGDHLGEVRVLAQKNKKTYIVKFTVTDLHETAELCGESFKIKPKTRDTTLQKIENRTIAIQKEDGHKCVITPVK
jgi:hypothetical protein